MEELFIVAVSVCKILTPNKTPLFCNSSGGRHKVPTRLALRQKEVPPIH